MSLTVEYASNKASETEIVKHLSHCDVDFVPPLSSRVAINDYARKIVSKATRFEAWSGGTLVGLVAAYCNDHEKRTAYITSVSVLKAWAGKGIATHLMTLCIKHAHALGMVRVSLEVALDNTSATKLYEKNGFVLDKADTPFVTMNLYLENEEEHEQPA
jgi:ribosomal protein S18 acetylase RimI-like enzyme